MRALCYDIPVDENHVAHAGEDLARVCGVCRLVWHTSIMCVWWRVNEHTGHVRDRTLTFTSFPGTVSTAYLRQTLSLSGGILDRPDSGPGKAVAESNGNRIE